VAGGTVSDRSGYATTIVARACGYAVVDVSDEVGGSAAFKVGQESSGARAPRPDADVALRDNGLALPRSLPRDGIVRITNEGKSAHQLTAFRIKRGITNAEALRAIRHGGRLNRIGTAAALSGLVSAGTVNHVELDVRAGRYVVASLYNPLTATGRPDVLRGLLGVTRVR
jgi:hypothetical protein